MNQDFFEYVLAATRVAGLAVVFVLTEMTSGAILYQSATLGPTGVSLQEVQDQIVRGRNIYPGGFQGVRFYLPSKSKVSRVGGHLIGLGLGGSEEGGRGDIFAAVVNLSGESDMPDSADFSTPDFLGSTLITPPRTSADVYGELRLTLDAGWYALVLGGGFLGSDRGLGFAAAVQNNPSTGDPRYIGWQSPYDGIDWTEGGVYDRNQRFVVEGVVVPEPGSGALLWCLVVGAWWRSRH
ncbi:hypothetical protein Pla123a_40390 [Posidoniimonas polymericola]|uniref:Uncharacterized protein n=2 Tax=Posidoniimonas polymericola TaxID=2528002 RepID=A0A5C5YBH9_9BACT|nr:hypothetical protein Pla123a_40390 [Posidoniimonas polymericola]